MGCCFIQKTHTFSSAGFVGGSGGIRKERSDGIGICPQIPSRIVNELLCSSVRMAHLKGKNKKQSTLCELLCFATNTVSHICLNGIQPKLPREPSRLTQAPNQGSHPSANKKPTLLSVGFVGGSGGIRKERSDGIGICPQIPSRIVNELLCSSVRMAHLKGEKQKAVHLV